MNKSSIPNIFTFINLSLGIISIIMCFKNNIASSALCILAAALLDIYDGRVARKIDAATLMGKELGSLSKLVSFGVAPAILMWDSSFFSLGMVGYVLLLLYPICGAYRLARFNVTEFHNTYIGMPITVAGSIAALDSLSLLKLSRHSGVSAILIALLSYLMVSTIKVKKI